MTKEENLHWLNQEIRTWESECQSKHPIKEALYAARKVLEREPCEDAVSRAEVLNLVRLNAFHAKSQIKAIENMPSVTPQEPNTWSLDDTREDFMHDVYNILDFLPTNDEANQIIDSFDMVTKGIKQEPRWIPVAERLPKDGGEYLVTLSLDVGGKEPVSEVRKDFYCILSKKWLYNNDDVTAWKPLPQPYKAESEDDE